MDSTRIIVAESHDGTYTYWLDRDGYVYQRSGEDGKWMGWLCHMSAWESTFMHSPQFKLIEVAG